MNPGPYPIQVCWITQLH
uniref:Uncharacterized protein n=1 Tax=Pyxicephalus adspersus TaxID=30357 RepID=A0A499QV31_PYXAD|nr:hypothetical protein maker-92A13-exonerate_protein2genome-gene-0.12 [Pyxicephalus adspersus]